MTRKTRQNREDALALSLARGSTVRAAARTAGYSERQTHRKLAEPEFRRRVSMIRQGLVDQAVGLLSAANADAAITLRKLLKATSPSIRLSAAKCILETSAKLREGLELWERVTSLEDNIRKQSQ